MRESQREERQGRVETTERGMKDMVRVRDREQREGEKRDVAGEKDSEDMS